MADHKPTILLIPGAWHKGSTFEPVASILRDQGYQAETITLPSAGGPASTTAHDDAEHIQRQYLARIVSSEKEVILVMHSYAGVPGTESVKGFARKDRAEQGKRGGVVGLIYLSAFIVPAGASVVTLLPGGLDSFMTMDGDMMMPKNPREKFYNDLDDATAQMYLADIVPHAPAAMSTPLTYAAYRDVDTSYIFCTKDTGFPLVGQQKIASIAGKDRVHTYSVDAGHFAMLSRPGDVAKAVMDVARRVVQN